MALIYFPIWLIGSILYLIFCGMVAVAAFFLCFLILMTHTIGFILGPIGGILGIIITYIMWGTISLGLVKSICNGVVYVWQAGFNSLNEMTIDKC